MIFMKIIREFGKILLLFRTQSLGPAKKGKLELERAFLERFESIVKLCKDKDIKMFTCLGDPEPNKTDTQKITKARDDFRKDQLESMRVDGITRYEKVVDSDLPIYEPILPIHQPSWDFSKNNANKIRKMRLLKFMGAATKIVIRGRVEKRLSKPSVNQTRFAASLEQQPAERM
jgi:hypothetical protein